MQEAFVKAGVVNEEVIQNEEIEYHVDQNGMMSASEVQKLVQELGKVRREKETLNTLLFMVRKERTEIKEAGIKLEEEYNELVDKYNEVVTKLVATTNVIEDIEGKLNYLTQEFDNTKKERAQEQAAQETAAEKEPVKVKYTSAQKKTTFGTAAIIGLVVGIVYYNRKFFFQQEE